MTALNHTNYTPCDIWYYILGGAVLMPSVILENVKASSYKGYLQADIEEANNLPEPRRSRALRKFRSKVKVELFDDLSKYRQCINALRRYRALPKQDRLSQLPCSDVHTAVSLKYSHLYNGFAHLIWLDDLLTEQLDLFDF